MKRIMISLLVVFAVLGGAFYLVQAQSTARKLPILTSAEFLNAKGTDIYIMLVGKKEGCPPCENAGQNVFIPLLDRYEKKPHIHVVKVDWEEKDPSVGKTIAQRFDVTASPTMMVVRNWQVMWRKVGFLSGEKETVQNEIINVVDSL